MSDGIWVLLALALFVAFIPECLTILPHSLGAIFRWKENITLQHSWQLQRARYLSCLATALTFSIICYRYSLGFPKIRLTLLMFIAFMLLREIISLAIRHNGIEQENWNAVKTCHLTLFHLLVILMFVTSCLDTFLSVPQDLVRGILHIEIVAVYLLNVSSEVQILRESSGVLPTFLYLCALEFLPITIIGVIAWMIPTVW